MGYTAQVLRNEGLQHLIKEIQARTTSGDYYQLIVTYDVYIALANEKAEENE